KGRIINLCLGFFIVIFIFLSATLYAVYYNDKVITKGVVVVAEVDAKSGNDLKSATLFKLHEGSLVYVLAENNNWFKIELADGKRGWLPKFAIRTVYKNI
ncbi:MAG: hypothetical protein D6734_12715, partial [Candidatus Schekmanbacteria bacterium]